VKRHAWPVFVFAFTATVSLLLWTQESTSQSGAPSSLPDPASMEEIVPRFAEASSILTPQLGKRPKDYFSPRKAIDGDWETCWAEAVEGAGIGEWIKLVWLTGETPTYIAVLPGWAKTKARWENNPRVKVAEITLSNGYRQIISFKDKMQLQFSPLKTGKPAEWLKLEIKQVYPGKRFQDTSISEIKVFRYKAPH